MLISDGKLVRICAMKSNNFARHERLNTNLFSNIKLVGDWIIVTIAQSKPNQEPIEKYALVKTIPYKKGRV